MVGVAKVFAIALLSVPLVSAAPCVEGSCLEEDVTSLVQVQKIVKKQNEKADGEADVKTDDKADVKADGEADVKGDVKTDDKEEDPSTEDVEMVEKLFEDNKGKHWKNPLLQGIKLVAGGQNLKSDFLDNRQELDKMVADMERRASKHYGAQDSQSHPRLHPSQHRLHHLDHAEKHILEGAPHLHKFNEFPLLHGLDHSMKDMLRALQHMFDPHQMDRMVQDAVDHDPEKYPKGNIMEAEMEIGWLHNVLQQIQWLRDHWHNQEVDSTQSQSVLPPPVGHGPIYPNPTLTRWRAEAHTMPGDTGIDGPVVQAFNNEWENEASKVERHNNRVFDEEFGRHSRAQMYDRALKKTMEMQDDQLQHSVQQNKERIQRTAAKRRQVEEDALHDQAEAQQDLMEATIVDANTKAAALEGKAVGEMIGEERSASHRKDVINDMEHRRLKREHEAEKRARQKAREEGVTDRQLIERQREAEGDYYLHHRGKEYRAMEDHDRRDEGLIRTDIEGPGGIENEMVKITSGSKVDGMLHDQAQEEQDTRNAVQKGAREVMRDEIADARADNDMGVLGPGPFYDPLVLPR